MCGTLLATSDRGGTAPEEVVRTLAAGSYTIRITGHGGFDVADPYQVRIRPLGTSALVLSSRTTLTPGHVRIAGEVLNASASRRGPVSVRARLYDSAGHLLATWTKAAYLPVIDALGRSPFVFTGPAPAGFHHATLGIVSASTTTATRIAPSVTGSGASPTPGSWTVTGTAKNPSSSTMRSVRVFITEYDTLGGVIAVGTVMPSPTTLGRGKSAVFSVAFGVLSPALTRFSARAVR